MRAAFIFRNVSARNERERTFWWLNIFFLWRCFSRVCVASSVFVGNSTENANNLLCIPCKHPNSVIFDSHWDAKWCKCLCIPSLQRNLSLCGSFVSAFAPKIPGGLWCYIKQTWIGSVWNGPIDDIYDAFGMFTLIHATRITNNNNNNKFEESQKPQTIKWTISN